MTVARPLEPDEERLLADSPDRQPHVSSARELRGELAVGVAFAATALVLTAVFQTGAVDLWVALALLVAYAIVARIEFDAGAGYTIPTQIVFVPMLFLLPVETVPWFVVLGAMLGRLPDFFSGRRSQWRALAALPDAWYSIGPVAVFLAAGIDGFDWSDWPVWVAALGAQFAVDYLVASGREWARLGVRPRLQWRIMGGVYMVDGLLAPVGLLGAAAAEDHRGLFALVVPLAFLTDLFARERRVRINHALELSSTYRRTAHLLGDVIGDDDEYTGAHSHGVVTLATEVADEMRLSERDRQLVEFGALLHDVGKIVIPKQIVNKPGPLSDEEWGVMRTHTIEGQRMLNRVGGMLIDVGTVVRASHERWDGGGYPDGLRGEEIPVAARIVACADAVSAMTTDRPYRAAMPWDVAIGELHESAGRHFDPVVVEATVRVVQRSMTPVRALQAPAA